MRQLFILFSFIILSNNLIGQSFNGLIQMTEVDQIHNVKIIDISKVENFALEHIPGSVNIWRPDITNTDTTYTGLIASESKIDSLMSKLEITKQDTIVVYDHKGGCDAARLKWVLNIYNYNKVSLLDGGLKSASNKDIQVKNSLLESNSKSDIRH